MLATNQRGSVFVFVTLLMVLLLIMVGLGLDTGHLVYIRAQGQAAVDAAALSAASAIPTGSVDDVTDRAAALNVKNNYIGSPKNPIKPTDVTFVQYSPNDGKITTSGITIANANGVRVALETSNPHTGATPSTAMLSPLLLTPLLNLFGTNIDTAANVEVSAVAVLKATPGLPIAIEEARCGQSNPQRLLQTSSKNDNSGYTTYGIGDSSAAEIKRILEAARTCSGAIPPVNVGFATQLNNGQISSVYKDFQDVFAADPSQCYLIPVVRNGSNWNQAEKIVDFARFCPSQNPVVQSGQDKYITGSLTCGQSPYNVKTVSCYVPTLVRDIESGM